MVQSMTMVGTTWGGRGSGGDVLFGLGQGGSCILKYLRASFQFPLVRRIPCKGRTFPPGPRQGDDKDFLSKTTATTATLFAPSVLQEMVPGGGGNPGPKPEVFLTPEVAVVECPLVICSRAAEVRPEGWKEEGEEEQILHQDMVAGLFQDLLNGNFSTGDTSVLEAPAARNGGDLGSSGGLALGDIPGTPNLHLEASSESGYQSSGSAEAVPPPLRSPAGPERHSGQDCASPSLDMLGYRSISSLVTQPVASSSCVEDALYNGQIQPCGPQLELQNTLLESPGALWFSATPALVPKQGGIPEHPTWVAPGKLGDFSCYTASLLSGYRSFTSALQDGSPAQEGDSSSSDALTPPYRPLLSLLRISNGSPFSLEGSQGAESVAWPEGPCHPMQT
ncbi:hypothetical protein JD844_019452 [Phrynosoma platyrhinos]|uniref:Uncharacterized protein n=1 Tax=Phrynosoma platyrhinos TaxID=52577 RepID=A0ABQ7TPI9_PHRPL|nr:hypothetical protein JD844_019452 [Phrynosoma platyrhinos]